MNDNPVIYVMVGIPGSGKSSKRVSIAEHLHNPVIISSDDYIEWFANQVGTTYGRVFSGAAPFAMRHCSALFDYAVSANRNIIWDQTNLTRKKRKKILDVVPGTYTKIAYVVDTPLEVALQRNLQRARTVPEKVIRDMYNQMELPHSDEGFDEIIIN